MLTTLSNLAGTVANSLAGAIAGKHSTHSYSHSYSYSYSPTFYSPQSIDLNELRPIPLAIPIPIT